MKKAELRKIISEYGTLRTRLAKKYDHKILERLKEIEHRYYHETGNDLKTIITD